MSFEYIKKQIDEVRTAIADAEKTYGRVPGSVKLVAVSKTFPAEAVQSAYETGQIIFGENRVQELQDKVPVLPSGIEWHLIGHLQSNKAGKAIELASMIHSVDSEKLIRRIDRLAGESGKTQKILLEINVSGEKSKFGETSDAAFKLAEIADNSPNIDLQGLMTMAPFGAEECELRRIFANLRELRNNIAANLGKELPELSMGMSSDYKQAIAEGATLVRIGTAIFGKRVY